LHVPLALLPLKEHTVQERRTYFLIVSGWMVWICGSNVRPPTNRISSHVCTPETQCLVFQKAAEVCQNILEIAQADPVETLQMQMNNIRWCKKKVFKNTKIKNALGI
jgi:hypothetical protein